MWVQNRTLYLLFFSVLELHFSLQSASFHQMVGAKPISSSQAKEKNEKVWPIYNLRLSVICNTISTVPSGFKATEINTHI